MLVKVFESEDMASALKKVKETLGPDALILSTRTVRKGGLGVLGRAMVEVTAAIEPPSAQPVPAAADTARRQGSLATRRRSHALVAGGDDLSYEQIWQGVQPRAGLPSAPPQKPVAPEPAPAPPAAARPRAGERVELRSTVSGDSPELASLRGEIDELKGLVRDLLRQGVRDNSAMVAAGAAPGAAQRPAANGGDASLQPLIELLRARGIDDEAAETIVRFASSRVAAPQLRQPETMRAVFAEVIADLIRISSLSTRSKSQRRLALIGPTGVGKTTTLAKLAAAHLLSGGKRAALITIDTYRIAAVEQLRVYGEIMNLPVEVVVSPEDMQGVLARHSDKDLILIDTAGRSPRDDVSLAEMARILSPELDTENCLVLSAATRDQDLYDAVARFGCVPINHLIFTKIDECSRLGALFNIHLRHNFPIAYLTNGQRVPEDILVADARQIAQLILGLG